MSMEIKSMALDLGRGAMLFLLLERFFGKLGYAILKNPASFENGGKKEISFMSKLKKLSKGACVLIVSIALLLISCIGASVVQTDFGNVTIKDLRWETESGHQMSALLLVPKTATKDNPAPAIVTSHGWYNTREMQDLNYVEYARRGFVVLSIDMYGHGNSETIENGTWWEDENNANGMYDAVKLAATLPYVDATRIGVTGHSNGALASRTAVMLDNKAETPLIAAALLVSNDAVYQDAETGEYINIFGSRDAGIVACQYDEFFHRVRNEDGTTTAPRDFLKQNTAQSFLYFGEDPTGKEPRVAGTVYHADIDGQDAMRFIYNPPIIHPWAHFSKNVVTNSINFFNESLSAPNMIDATNQIWQVKVVFNFIGLVGFMMFMVGFALCMLKTRFFASLRAEKTPRRPSFPAAAVRAGCGARLLSPRCSRWSCTCRCTSGAAQTSPRFGASSLIRTTSACGACCAACLLC